MKILIKYSPFLLALLVYQVKGAHLETPPESEASQTPLFQEATGNDLEKLKAERDAPSCAVHSGNTQMIKLLLAAGANSITAPVKADDTKAIALIESKNKKFYEQSLAFINSLFAKNLDEARKLFVAGIEVNVKYPGNDYTALHVAADKGLKDIVKMLIEAKADVNAKNTFEESPLFLATNRGDKESVKLLINNKANINASNDQGFVPIHWAAMRGEKEMLQMLIENKAYVNAISKFHDTPLHFALHNNKDDKEIIDMLVKAGAV